MILILSSDDDFARRGMTLDDSAVDARSDGVLVGIEALAVGVSRRAVFFRHAGSVGVVGDADAVAAVEVAVGGGHGMC